jgi:hypothetical protein
MKNCPHCGKSLESKEKQWLRSLKTISHIRIMTKMLKDMGKGLPLKDRLTLLKTLKQTEATYAKNL